MQNCQKATILIKGEYDKRTNKHTATTKKNVIYVVVNIM